MAKPYEHCATNLNASDIPLALYVHLPWCERKCPYCDFNSHEQFDSSLETGYIDALLTDLRQQLVNVGSRPLFSVFLGGGTPSLFSGASIARLLSGIDQIWSISPTTEITMEANPGSAEASRFADYRSAGVNRLSLGIQSFADAHLTALGRVHDSAQAMQAIQLAKQHFDRFNLDIMHGLPGQKIETALDDLERVTREGWESREREAEKAWVIVDEETENLLASISGAPSGYHEEEQLSDGLEILRQEALRASGGNADQATRMLLERLKEGSRLELERSGRQDIGEGQ